MSGEFFLYKYFNVEGTIPSGLTRLKIVSEILVNKEIFVPSLELLNDPFESIINSQKGTDASQVKDQRGVLSFTTNYRNILMWSHYCSSHTGIAIKFKINSKSIPQFKKVQYIQDREELTTLDSIIVKSSAWSYENEYRVVFDNSSMKINLDRIGLTIEGLIIGFKTPIHIKDQLKDVCLATDLKCGEISLTSNFSCEVSSLKTIEDRYKDDHMERQRDEEMREDFSPYIEDDHYPEDAYDPYEHYYKAAENSEEFQNIIRKKSKLKKDLGIV